MDLRTTVGTRVANAVANLQAQATATAKWQQQIASGKRLEKPSDGPSDFVTLIDYKARSRRLDAYLGSINDATDALNEGVNHLNEAQQVLTRANVLAAEAANGSTDSQAYEAIATEVDAILSRFLELGNARVGNRYLFGGTATTTQPFVVSATDAAGRPTAITYQGADERSQGLIGPNQSVDTIYPGNRVLQGSADAFQALIELRDTLRDTSLTQTQKADALNQRMASLGAAQGQILNTIGEQASSLENLEALTNRISDIKVGVQGRASDLEATDFAEAAVKFQEQQSAFQATLGVTAKIFDSSLLDFVR